MARNNSGTESSRGCGEFTRNVGELAVGVGILALVAAGLSEISLG